MGVNGGNCGGDGSTLSRSHLVVGLGSWCGSGRGFIGHYYSAFAMSEQARRGAAGGQVRGARFWVQHGRAMTVSVLRNGGTSEARNCTARSNHHECSHETACMAQRSWSVHQAPARNAQRAVHPKPSASITFLLISGALLTLPFFTLSHWLQLAGVPHACLTSTRRTRVKEYRQPLRYTCRRYTCVLCRQNAYRELDTGLNSTYRSGRMAEIVKSKGNQGNGQKISSQVYAEVSESQPQTHPCGRDSISQFRQPTRRVMFRSRQLCP